MSPSAWFRDTMKLSAKSVPKKCGGTGTAKRLIILPGRSVTNPWGLAPGEVTDPTRKEVPGRLGLCMTTGRG